MTIASVDDVSRTLQQGADGVWYAPDDRDVSYPAAGHSNCLAVEEGSFWFHHRNEAIRTLVEAIPPPEGVVLDVGGGNGFVSLMLEATGLEVILIEPGATGVRNARDRGVSNVVCATTQSAGIREGSVAAVGLFDVIEHIEDDHGFLQHIGSLLQPDGLVYATVPAYQLLWSNEDESAGHHRRYSRREISDAFDRAGFEVEFASYFFRPLPLPVFCVRTLPHRLRSIFRRTSAAPPQPNEPAGPQTPSTSSVSRSHAVGGGIVARTIRRILRPEIEHISSQSPMRVGGSVLVAARRH